MQNGHFPDSPFFPLKQLLQPQICSSSAPSPSCTLAGRAAPHDPSPAPWHGEGLPIHPLLHPGRQGEGILIPPPSCIWDRGSQPILSWTLAGRALPQGPRSTCAAKSALTAARAGPRDTGHTDRMTLLVSEPRGSTWTCPQGAAPMAVSLTW